MRQDFEDGHELQTVSLDPDSQIPDYANPAAAGPVPLSATAQLHGVVYWDGGNSALNADPYVLAGQPLANPGYRSNSYGASMAGHPYLPGVSRPSLRDTIAFSFAGQSSRQLVDDFGVVPTLQERQGNFSGLTDATGQPLLIYRPDTGKPFPNNTLDTPLSPAATGLLRYLPSPNLQSAGLNYRLLTTEGIRNSSAGASYQHQFSGSSQDDVALTQSLSANFNYGEIANDVVNIFTILGGRQWIDGYAVSAGYRIGKGSWIANVSAIASGNRARLTNYFTGKEDIASETGLYQTNFKDPINTDPRNYGLPNLVFNNYTGFNETQPNVQITQRTGFSAAAGWIHPRHNLRWGADFNHVDFNVFGGTNATGTYVFSGGYTENVNALAVEPPTSGSSFADFLLGLPQATRIESAAQKAYMRQNNYDLYARDDWHVAPNLTVLAGLRYDNDSPFVESSNRLSTLDYAPDFSLVAPVQPNGVGPVSGFQYGRSLVRPDRNNFSPHLGFSWAAGKKTTLRGGYGIYYTEAQYATFIQNLAYQPPFAHVESNVNLVDFLTFFTLQYGFGNLADEGNYAISHRYRVPYVQTWYADVQQSLPLDVVLDIGYEGAKGTRLDVVDAPGFYNNQSFASAFFDFEDSSAFSNFNALVARINRRMGAGLAFEATYAYAHSIDNASSIEGGNWVVAQNWQDLLAEESNSSFDIRQELTASFVYQLPLGREKLWLHQKTWASALGDWTISGVATFAAGMPLTPYISASVSEVQRGTHGSVRPNRVPNLPIMAGGHHIRHWFDTAAFSQNFAPGQLFGTASRYSIPGPGVESVNLSLSKIFALEGPRSLEVRATASNAFNIVQYSGINPQISSSTFGYVNAVQPMRQFTFLARFRF
jgi:trimeric autotransporter adhesin